MTQTALAFGIERPTTLDEALNVIDRLSGSVATVRATYEDQQRGPREGRAFNSTIDSLVAARKSLKAGRPDDALYHLETALSWLDSGWLCRA